MTISAADRGVLAHSLVLYRDLSEALSERIAQLRAEGGDADCRDRLAAIKDHQRTLQTVLDIEVSLDKRTKAGAGGAANELDLAAARAEIAQRLAVWLAEG